MNRRDMDPDRLLDGMISEIRDEPIDEQEMEQSRRRVWDRINAKESVPARLSTCGDFQALIPAYRDGSLAPGRKMLLEDHAHQCVVCRKVLFGEVAPAPVVIEMPVRRMTRGRWMAVAASAAVALIAGRWIYEQVAPAPGGSRATVQTVDGAVFRLIDGRLEPATVGMQLADRDILRTAANSSAVVQLMDKSVVEVGQRAEFRVSAARRDVTVHLQRGPIIVQAAKRRTGHLYVATGDSRIAVTGTVFSVNRGAKGTRVSVMEGEVVVENNRNDKILHAGDQIATHRSIESVPIKDEIAWSRHAADHVKTLQDMVAIKESLQNVRMPGIRYQSRLMDAVPANAVVFLSVPNARDAIADARSLLASELRRNGAANDERFNEFIDRIGRFSEYLGEEFVVAGVRSGSQLTAVAIADVHRPGLPQFLDAEKLKAGETNVQIVEGNDAIRSRKNGEMLVSLRNNRIAIGVDETLVNGAFAGGTSFASTPFGQRIAQAFQQGTGILLAVDLQSVISSNAQAKDQAVINRLGADSLRYLIAEQKTFNGKTQHSAVLNFDGERHGLASWLGAPGPMGGLGFISPNAQFAFSVITKNPAQSIDELLALLASKSPDGAAKLAEIQRTIGVDIKQDIAACLGSEATFALDGPLLPTPSWKMIVEVNQQDRLQQAIAKIVSAFNAEANKHGDGIVLDVQTLTPPVSNVTKLYTIRFTGNKPAVAPEIHYAYSDGYLVAAATTDLVWNAIHGRSSGVRLDTSGQFRRLLPTDQNANFSGMIYQNAQEALKLLSNVSPEQQDKLRELADKVGPTLIAAYAEADRIQVTTYGSSMDFLMQTAFSPAFYGPRRTKMHLQKYGTSREAAAYR